ncbi:ABC transporter substrate-binding protein [Acuticoccus sp. I52.16.1]|uniref:ABC transporter substrate-binding protein n=1 Tax=Acuticoccus sp. I52.16.1 TaxID=2928472 RepID=UPI001FD36240|nr:ABC transporter substrate-binding protein [Acuticoccus sp. I52.16.1]UOM35462.1 ABC transporter substrate-binding protein [Acuticoccus sp. I52.16.1]
MTRFGRSLIALAGTLAVLGSWLPSGPAGADELPTVRLALLKFGTVNWEADTIVREGLDTANGFHLEIVPFAGGNATQVALLSGDVHVSTGDWLFASRQRAMGAAMTFVPYSTSMGGVVARCDAGYEGLADLAGKTIGVAGGPLDKSWLMIRGMAEGELGLDIAGETRQVFGAPPLLAEKLRQGELDAALNYWHYNARLETEGYCEIVSAQDAAEALGARGELSAIGYIFDEEWADANPRVAAGFVAASHAAKALLAKDDAAWEPLREAMNAENDAVFAQLVKRWREGVPTSPPAQEEADTAAVYAYLAKVGGEALVGPARTMAPGTFWSGLAAAD